MGEAGGVVCGQQPTGKGRETSGVRGVKGEGGNDGRKEEERCGERCGEGEVTEEGGGGMKVAEDREDREKAGVREEGKDGEEEEEESGEGETETVGEEGKEEGEEVIGGGEGEKEEMQDTTTSNAI